MNDILTECFPLYRGDDYVFHGWDDGAEKNVIGFYNRQKINPQEPDLRLFYTSASGREEKPFLSLWLKTSRTGRKYLIGNSDGVCYVGLIHFNRLDDSEPYLTIYYVIKAN